MNIEKITFYVTKTTTFEIVMSKENGYEMPETPKELIDMVNTIKNNPARELAWASDNAIDDDMAVDDYDIVESK